MFLGDMVSLQPRRLQYSPYSPFSLREHPEKRSRTLQVPFRSFGQLHVRPERRSLSPLLFSGKIVEPRQKRGFVPARAAVIWWSSRPLTRLYPSVWNDDCNKYRSKGGSN